MAGQGYRTWTAGEQLTDTKMQQYLQDQSVMRFANSTARSSALAGVVSEGMVSYLDDTNRIEVYNGTAWAQVTPDVPNASPGTAGIVRGQTGTNDAQAASIGAEALNVYTPNGLVASVAFGNYALRNADADLNTAVGSNAGRNITTGRSNTVIGYSTLFGETTGEGNTVVGGGAGFRYFNGSNNNTIIGFQAAGQTSNTHTGNNNTIIGYDSLPSSTTVSNEITLGNSSITTLRCQVTSITSLSDERDKTDITNLSYGLDLVKALRPVEFVWNTRDGAKVGIKDIGFIAQELAEVEDAHDPDALQLTLRNNPDRLEATQGRLIPILVKAIQELSAKVEELENASKCNCA